MGSAGVKNLEVHGAKLRITFYIAGERCREVLELEPTKSNIAAAAKLLARIEREIANGVFDYLAEFPHSKRAKAMAKAVSTPQGKTFGEACTAYLATLTMKPPATVSQYTNALGVWKGLFGENTPLLDITYDRIAEVVGSTPWSGPKLLNNYLVPLRGVFDMEYRGRRAIDNPMAGVKNAKVPKKKPDPLSPEERDLVLADMRLRQDPRVWAYFAWQFATGMRVEETIALRWSDIDERSGTARVQRVRTFKGSERDETKTGAERDVILTPAALEALAVMKPYTKLKGGDIFEHPELGKPWHDDRAQRETYWAPTLKRLGIRARRAYATRHTCATAGLMAGVNPAFMAEQLGHSVRMFLETYSRWIRGVQDKAQIALLAQATATAPITAPNREAAA